MDRKDKLQTKVLPKVLVYNMGHTETSASTKTLRMSPLRGIPKRQPITPIQAFRL